MGGEEEDAIVFDACLLAGSSKYLDRRLYLMDSTIVYWGDGRPAITRFGMSVI